jgi:hypothetical protein
MNKHSVISDSPIPDFPLPYPTGHRPHARHNAWERAVTVIEHLGLGSPNPMARLATISRIAKVIADYDRLDRDARAIEVAADMREVAADREAGG